MKIYGNNLDFTVHLFFIGFENVINAQNRYA